MRSRGHSPAIIRMLHYNTLQRRLCMARRILRGAAFTWGGNSVHDVVIIGSGCAGLTAAIYAARANLKPLVIDGYEPGGQLTLTTMVENFPGFPEGILGPELIEQMRKQAQRFGAEFREGAVSAVDFSRPPYHITVAKESFRAKTVIVAAGAS